MYSATAIACKRIINVNGKKNKIRKKYSDLSGRLEVIKYESTGVVEAARTNSTTTKER